MSTPDTSGGSSGTPQGVSEDRRTNVPTGVAYITDNPDIEDDSLPLDGSLTFKDTENIDQAGLHPDETRILTGSEMTQTAAGTIDVSTLPPPESLDTTQTANDINRS